jgi:medium-chain acyl-[acyl-carrier-protein] hydrolase
VPITAYGGEHDAEVSFQDLQAWEMETAQSFRMRMFPGDHFFLKSHCTTVVKTLQGDLSPLMAMDRAVIHS